jgi:hypothetical protein
MHDDIKYIIYILYICVKFLLMHRISIIYSYLDHYNMDYTLFITCMPVYNVKMICPVSMTMKQF